MQFTSCLWTHSSDGHMIFSAWVCQISVMIDSKEEGMNWGVINISLPSDTGLILDFCPANERQRYFVTTSLIGWSKT